MSVDWSYAKLTKAVSEAGGPDAYHNAVYLEGAKSMIPWLYVAVGVGAILDRFGPKIVGFTKKKVGKIRKEHSGLKDMAVDEKTEEKSLCPENN